MACPECGGRVVPIHYGYVEFVDIERAIMGDIVIGQRFGLEKWHCKKCDKSYIDIE